MLVQNDNDEIVIRMSREEMGKYFNQTVNERDSLPDLFKEIYKNNYNFNGFNQLNE